MFSNNEALMKHIFNISYKEMYVMKGVLWTVIFLTRILSRSVNFNTRVSKSLSGVRLSWWCNGKCSDLNAEGPEFESGSRTCSLL